MKSHKTLIVQVILFIVYLKALKKEKNTRKGSSKLKSESDVSFENGVKCWYLKRFGQHGATSLN